MDNKNDILWSDDAFDEYVDPKYPDDWYTDPNSRYTTPVYHGALNNLSEVETFLAKYNHDNGYRYIEPNTGKGTALRLGDTISIIDGAYSKKWMIAGFDIESSRAAADGTIYDNGYGIALIPNISEHLGYRTWNDSYTLTGAYKSSTMNTSHLPTIATNLQTVLGSHLVNRNVLLSSSINSSYESNAYTWTTAYCTLLSYYQVTGTAVPSTAYNPLYDNGEANYKLPLVNYISSFGNNYSWLRGVIAKYINSSGSTRFGVYQIKSYFATSIQDPNSYAYIYPLIYIR